MLKRLPISLPAYLVLILKLIGFYAAVFFVSRLIFCFINNPASNHEPLDYYAAAFFMGFRFDMIIISYLMMFPALALFIQQAYLKQNVIIVQIIKFYLWLVTLLVFFIACADIPYFSQFGSHINKSVMVWRMSPGYTLKLIFSSFFYWGFFLLFLCFYAICIFFFQKIFQNYQHVVREEKNRSHFKNISLFLLTAFALFAFARGRLASKSTMHEGMAIVSQNAFINQIPLNPNFTLIKSLSRKEANTDYLKNIETDLKACAAFYNQNYFPAKGVLSEPILSSSPVDSIKKMNVVVVLMESLNMSKMGYHNNKNLSPYLTELAKESVFFDRFFSSGIHTFNGLFSTSSGFPSIYAEQGLRQYTKQPFTTLANLLKPYGYKSYFCTTHDAVFDNMEGFFKLNGYDNIISESDFSLSESIGVTGVPDHLLYKKLIERMNVEQGNSPFVAYVMTGTDHGPWHIPENIPFKPTGQSFQENASQYADWSVGQFMEEAKKQKWYKNTVFVFLGDHGQIMNDPYEMPITYHHIPLIIHCPSLLSPALTHNLGYQPDVVKTLASLLNVSYKNFSFGENILEKKRPFVFFSADDKLGYVTEDDYFFYHTISDNQKKFVKYVELDPKDYYSQNKYRADSLYALTQALYNSARYYLKENYTTY